MKRVTTAFGICVLLFVSEAASAWPFTWTGGDPLINSWLAGPNWGPLNPWPFPGSAAVGDTVLIDNGAPRPMAVVDGAVPFAVDWVIVDADMADCSLMLVIDVNGSLTVSDGNNTGFLWLIAGSHVQGVNIVPDDAILWVAGGMLATEQLQFEGTTNNTGWAFGLFDVNVTVQNPCDGLIDTYMEGYVGIDFTNFVTVDAKDLGIGNCLNGDEANVSLSGSGTLSACSIEIKGSAVAHTIVTANDEPLFQTYGG